MREPGEFATHSFFFSYDGQQRAKNKQDSWGVFQGCTGFWMAGCWLARLLHHLKLHYHGPRLGVISFLVFPRDVTLKKVGCLWITTGWSVICPLGC